LTVKLTAFLVTLVGVWAALATIAPGVFQVKSEQPLMQYLWGPKTVGIAAILIALFISAFVLDLAKKVERTEASSLQQVAKVVIDLMNAAQSKPQPIAQPTPGASARDVDLANRLGDLRRAGWKRYLEWLARYPDAGKQAEQWRLEVLDILDRNCGKAIAIRFNTPTMREAQQMGGWLVPVNEHGHRVDRLGEIINDIIAGKLTARAG